MWRLPKIQFDHVEITAARLKIYDAICSRNTMALVRANEAEYAHLTAYGWCLWKIFGK